jgi:hypothetical protein
MSQNISSALLILDAKYQNIIKAQDVDIIFKTATMTITNHQDEQRQQQQQAWQELQGWIVRSTVYVLGPLVAGARR